MKKPLLHQSFHHAARGLQEMLLNERNFQIEVVAFLINILLILYLQVSAIEAAVIIIICATVLSLEAVNTAIEQICDVVQPSVDPRIKAVKDIAAGAVLLVSISSVIVGALIYLPYLY